MGPIKQVSRADFAQRLTRILRKRGITRLELAKRLGKPVTTVYSYFHNPSATVRDNTIIEVSRALSVDTDYFFEPDSAEGGEL